MIILEFNPNIFWLLLSLRGIEKLRKCIDCLEVVVQLFLTTNFYNLADVAAVLIWGCVVI